MQHQDEITLRKLNQMVGSVAKRDLTLLNEIDGTIDCLRDAKAEMDLYAQMTLAQVERVKNAANVLDENGSIINILEQSRDVFGELHSKLAAKSDAARTDPNLNPEDGVFEAYCDLMNSVAELHNAINELCWAIGEHDADFDPVAPGGPYKTADELLAALGA
jgi:hypothetical protein